MQSFTPKCRDADAGDDDDDDDEPLTPLGRLFCQPLMTNVIHCAFAFPSTIDVALFKAQLPSSLMLQHPRFCSLMLRDSRGRERWRATQVDIDQHVRVHRQPLSNDPSISDEDAVNDFMADLSMSSPLPEDKPLWEIHLLLAHNTAVYRVHHALGDGTSLMSLFPGCRKEDPSEKSLGRTSAPVPVRRWWSVWTLVKVVWYSLIYVLEMFLRILWVKDRNTAFSGGAGVELWPRKLVSARFRLDDMKIVKGAVAGATINDVLIGIISCGLSRYLDIVTSSDPKAAAPEEGLRITGLSMVNVRQEKGLIQELSDRSSSGGTQWGNIYGMLILPVHYDSNNSKNNSIQFVKRAKAMMDKKKLSIAALILYRIQHLITFLFGPKFASILIYRSFCNTSFMVSNIVGPKEQITVGGNPVKSLRISSTSFPHAMTMHMVSYEGMAYLQILVAKEVIPEPKVLARCFEDTMHDMKEAACMHY